MVLIPQQQPASFRVLIATPLFDGRLWAEMAETLFKIVVHEYTGLTFEWRRFSGAGVAAARNELTGMMYLLKCDAVLFMDADVQENPSDVFRLMGHRQHIIAGLYPKKNDNLAWCANFIDGAKPDAKGLLEVENSGSGFQLISKHAIDALRKAFPARRYTRGIQTAGITELWDLFGMGVVEDTYITEDFYISHLARQIGIKTYVDVNVRLDHWGVKRWSGKDPAMSEPWK